MQGTSRGPCSPAGPGDTLEAAVAVGTQGSAAHRPPDGCHAEQLGGRLLLCPHPGLLQHPEGQMGQKKGCQAPSPCCPLSMPGLTWRELGRSKRRERSNARLVALPRGAEEAPLALPPWLVRSTAGAEAAMMLLALAVHAATGHCSSHVLHKYLSCRRWWDGPLSLFTWPWDPQGKPFPRGTPGHGARSSAPSARLCPDGPSAGTGTMPWSARDSGSFRELLLLHPFGSTSPTISAEEITLLMQPLSTFGYPKKVYPWAPAQCTQGHRAGTNASAHLLLATQQV